MAEEEGIEEYPTAGDNSPGSELELPGREEPKAWGGEQGQGVAQMLHAERLVIADVTKRRGVLQLQYSSRSYMTVV